MTESLQNACVNFGKFAAALLLSSALQGCEHIAVMARSGVGKAVICGGGGLLTGGATYYGCGALTGKKAECILLAAAAALADGLVCWWQLSEKIVEDYDLTAETLNYDPKQGTVLKILDFSAEPKTTHPGDEVKIKVSYALMSPNPTEEITYQRNITVPGENKARTVVLTHQPGTWGSGDDYSYKVDNDSPEGKIEMTLEIKLSNGSVSDRRTLCFNITRQSQPDPSQLCPATETGSAPQNGGKIFTASKVKKYAAICSSPDTHCKSSKSKKYLANATANEQFPLLGEQWSGATHWYKIKLQDGREGWLRAANGTVLGK